MAKRNKAKFAPKSRKSSLRIEALEQRQLLATVTGAGVEVASDVLLGGLRFDQVLMTGAAVTVQADPGQVVRVSFLDNTGDIVQAEFAGSGKFTVTLEDLKLVGSTGYNNANPTQTFPADVTGADGSKYTKGSTINYVQGLASIFVDNPEFDTNVSVYSAGLLTNAGFFAGQAKQGGNHFADIARIIVVGDPTNEAAYNNMGAIRAANAIFSANNGVVGIRAENIAIQNTVIIGDLDATGSGVPTLVFHPLSQFVELKVAGGDLVQSNGSGFATSSGANISGAGGFDRFLSIDGARSDFNPAATKQANIDSGAFLLRSGLSQDTIALTPINQNVTMEGDWTYDLAAGTASQSLSGQTYNFKFAGSGQAQLDSMFNHRSFTNLTVKGADLAANTEINLAKVSGNMDFTGNVLGRIEANGLFATIGALKINGNLLGEVYVAGIDRTLGLGRDAFQNKIGSVTITGNVGSDSLSGAFIIAEEIGDVSITGNLSGLISTDLGQTGLFSGFVLSGTSFTDYDGKIGNVSIGGNISSGSVHGMTGIGNINVGGDITGAGVGALPGIFATNSAQASVAIGLSAANLSVGRIGTLTVVGDVDLAMSNALLINIAEEGNFGNVSIQGNGLLGRVDGNDVLLNGRISIGGGFGNTANTTGTITIADAKSTDPRGTDIDFGGVLIGAGVPNAFSVLPFVNLIPANAVGKIGAISITGKGEDTDFNLSGSIGAFNLGADIIEITSFSVTGFEDIMLSNALDFTLDPLGLTVTAIQGSKIGALTLTPIAGVGSNDANDGKGTGVATSVTINSNILVNDGAPNKGETFAGLNINLGLTNSTVTVGGLIQTNDFLKGTGSSIGPIILTARTVNFTSPPGGSVRAETIGNVTLTAGGGALNATPTLTGVVIGNIIATGGNTVNFGGQIGSETLGVGNDRTESVGNFTISTTGTQSVTFNPVVDSDLIGTTTLTAGNGTITFGAVLDARSYQGVTGSYGAISATSSTRGNIAFNGDLAGTGGAITLSTGTVGTVSGDIGITTIFRSGGAGTLTATTAGIVGAGNDAGNITYAADVVGGSTGVTTLQSTVNGNITYGGTNATTVNSFFAGNVGAVNIMTKDIGTVFYTGAFATTADSFVGGSDSNDDGLAVGTVTISTEKGNVGVNPYYDRRVNSTGALSVTTTEGDITYAATSVGNGAGGNAVANSIAAGNRPGSIGPVTLLTTGADGDIIVTAQLESTSFGGLSATTQALDTVTPATSSTINLTNADIWAATVGPTTLITAEGSITVDAASSLRGFTNGTGTNTSVANIVATVAAKGALIFNGVIQATTNRLATDNTGTMTVGDLTLTGNSTGNIAFGGQVLVGVADLAVNPLLLDGIFDAGTIGNMTFNGNTTFAAASQFGSETTQTTLQALQNGQNQNDQFALLASSIAGFKVSGDATHASAALDTDGFLRAGSLGSFEITGATTLAGHTNNGAAGLIFVPQLGTVKLGSSTGATTLTAGSATAPVFVAHDIGGIAFNSKTTTLAGGTVFLALDATSDLDTIGDITGAGSIVGSAISSLTGIRAEIEASKVGNINVTAAVDASSPLASLLVNFDVRASNIRGNAAVDVDAGTAGNQGGTHAITGETIATTGGNLSSFAIGNVTVIGSPVNGLDATFLFAANNSFVATGAMGNITITGNTFGATQTKMFAAASAAWFTVGDSDALNGAANSATDFNGDGIISNLLNPGVTETTSDFTGTTAKVTIGNVSVFVDNSAPFVPPIQDFDGVGGATGTATDGFVILAGVQLNGAGRLADSAVPGTRGARIEADLDGFISSILLQNGEIADIAAKNAETGGTAGFGSVIGVAGDGTAADDIGDIVNIITVPIVPLEDGETVIIGDNNATDDTLWDVNEVLVYVV